ncbi:MAG: hypothetical protein ACTSVU_05550 [Promethearchaeota archaeon]
MVNLNKNALYGNKYVNIRNGELFLGKFKVNDLGEKYGTPAFYFLTDKVRDNLNHIRKCFESVFPKCRGFYSTKSNYLEPIVEVVRDSGFGAEIIGLPEVHLLDSIDFSFHRVLGGGPYLSDEFLEAMIQRGTEYIVVYDLEDLTRVNQKINEFKENKSSEDSEFRQKILIRFRAPKYTGRHGIPFNPENINLLKSLLEECPNLKFEGILSHMGTRMKALVNYQKNFSFIIEVLNALKNLAGLYCNIIDIGGGFPNADAMKAPFFTKILREVYNDLVEAGWGECEIFYEPGRFIVGDVGFCSATVYKYSPLFHTAFLDVGNNLIPKFMKSALRFYNVNKITELPNQPVDFMGNVPSDQDILVKNYNFTPSVAKGDKVLIANVGAYALTWSTRFPYGLPAIICIDGEKISLFRSLNDSRDFIIH